jgi:hypothetical protein
MDGRHVTVSVRDYDAMNEAAAMHPDGKRIALVAGTPRGAEIRLLEDFLPAPAGR